MPSQVTIDEHERHMLVHTLTGSEPGGQRNWWAAGIHDRTDYPRLCGLVRKGLMERGLDFMGGNEPCVYFHATVDGARLVGLPYIPPTRRWD